MPLKTLIFDVGGVIVPLDFARGYAAMESLCGIPAAEIPKRIGTTDLVRRFEVGRIEPRAFFAELSALLGLTIDYSQFCELWSAIFRPGSLIPDSLLADLKRRYRLLLLSNTNAIHYPIVVEQFPELRHFDAAVLSYEVGAMKPSPEIYMAAVGKAGCRPEECFFTDDILPYVEAARKVGIDAVQFVNADQLRAELRARGALE